MPASPDRDGHHDELQRVRVDKWLWAARFYKTRSQATEAVDGGKVHVNGERAKPAKPLQIGDELRLRQGPYEYRLVVKALAERRGPASRAAALYEETEESRHTRDKVALQMKVVHAAFIPDQRGRPTKRDRRAIERLKRGD